MFWWQNVSVFWGQVLGPVVRWRSSGREEQSLGAKIQIIIVNSYRTNFPYFFSSKRYNQVHVQRGKNTEFYSQSSHYIYVSSMYFKKFREINFCTNVHMSLVILPEFKNRLPFHLFTYCAKKNNANNLAKNLIWRIICKHPRFHCVYSVTNSHSLKKYFAKSTL